MPPGAFFFFAGHVVRRCNLSHETFRNTRSKKKTRPCDFLVRTDAPKTPLGTYVQNFEDTPGAGIMTPQKQRGSASERRTAHRTQKEHVQCAFFFAPRAARAHSLTLLFVEMLYRLGPREKDSTPNKKSTSSARFFFCSPRGPGSLTHLFRSSNTINVGSRKRNARGTKKNRKWHAYGAKKNACSIPEVETLIKSPKVIVESKQ